jgi:hypothetical protein
MFTKISSLFILSCLISACGLVALPGADKVVLVKVGTPQGKCKELGQVSARTNADSYSGDERTEKELKNQAVVIGANTIKITQVTRTKQGGINTIFGIAYQCY